MNETSTPLMMDTNEAPSRQRQESIPFNQPFIAGKELEYIAEAVRAGKLSGNGLFTKRCQTWFEERYGFGKCLLTTSCTDVLEMAAMLMDSGSRGRLHMQNGGPWSDCRCERGIAG